VSIDMYPEYVAADVVAGVVDFSLAANLRLGPVIMIEPRLGASLLGASIRVQPCARITRTASSRWTTRCIPYPV